MPVEPTKKLTYQKIASEVVQGSGRRETYGGQAIVDRRDDEGVPHPNETSCGECCIFISDGQQGAGTHKKDELVE